MVQDQEEMNGCGLNGDKVGAFTVSPREKGRKNKRKLADPSQQNVASLTEFPRYELPSLKSQNHLSDNMLIGEVSNQLQVEKSESVGWDDPFACHLEHLLSSNLITLFLNAIKQVIDCGYTDNDVLEAISGSRLYCGGDDLVSNIVNNTLNVLKNRKEDSCSRDFVFEDLQQLVTYTLVEMICIVKEVRPSLSTVEAMWRLLMCDLNVLQASEVEGDGFVRSPGFSSSKSPESLGAECNPPNYSDTENPKPPQFNAQINRNEPLKFGNFPNIPNSKKAHSCGTTSGKEASSCNTVSCEGIKSTSFTLVSGEKLISRRQGRTKKEIAILRQKSYVEKIRTYNKGSGYKAAKFASVGKFLLEKRAKSSELVARNYSSKITAEIGVKVSLADDTSCLVRKSSSILDSPVLVVDENGCVTALPATSGTSDSKTKHGSESEEKDSTSSKLVPDYYAGILYDASLGIYVPRDKKDELILKLVPRVNELHNELQVWTDWANQKVKEATGRLLKDQPELKALRKEREEAEKHKKEKQLLEENTMKRLSEMELALKNATSQFQKANNAVRRLEVEQTLLKKEMEAANIKAAKTAESCREAKERGQRSLKDTHSWEGQKNLLQDELKGQIDKVKMLQKEVIKAKTHQNQIEATLKKEKTVKGKLISEASSIEKERKELEELGKAEEERIKAKAETDVKYYIINIKRLEREISNLKLKSDYSRILALKKGVNGSNETQRENLGMTKVKRERECVMCLSEEMSVIFFPCAHQVLCFKCNQLHEKEGMLDCPSCRGTIQRRIQARFARSW